MRLLRLMLVLGMMMVCLASVPPLWRPSRDRILSALADETRRWESAAQIAQAESQRVVRDLESIAQRQAEARVRDSLLAVLIPYAVWHAVFLTLFLAVAFCLYRFYVRRYRPLQQRVIELQTACERKQRLLEQIERGYPPPPLREFLRRSTHR